MGFFREAECWQEERQQATQQKNQLVQGKGLVSDLIYTVQFTKGHKISLDEVLPHNFTMNTSRPYFSFCFLLSVLLGFLKRFF